MITNNKKSNDNCNNFSQEAENTRKLEKQKAHGKVKKQKNMLVCFYFSWLLVFCLLSGKNQNENQTVICGLLLFHMFFSFSSTFPFAKCFSFLAVLIILAPVPRGRVVALQYNGQWFV